MTDKLYQSPVVFDEEHHTYTLGDKQLSGVTSIIAWLFPDTYAGIPQSVLYKAAEHGTLIHKKCELCDSMGIADEPIVKRYQELIQEHGLYVRCSEYLVSDEKHIASSIDKVFDDNSIGDIKTTSKLHIRNVAIQLSIYAWLYEVSNKLQVPHLYVIWLPKEQYGEPAVYEVPRIPYGWCQRCVEAYVNGGDPQPLVEELSMMGLDADDVKRKRVEGEIPESLQSLVDELVIVKKQKDIFDAREKELKDAILEAMTGRGEDKWANDIIQFSRRAESTRESVDTKELKAKMPDVYESFKKVTKVAASLTYKIL